jgi:putative ABC transport system permease protein
VRYRSEPDPLKRRDPANDLDAEIQAHLAMRVEALMAGGLSEEEAHAEALRRFGDVEQARSALASAVRRTERRLRWSAALDGFLQDFRLALRGTRRSPGFTALWLLILGTAIALSSLTFAVTHQVLLRPLPYPDPSRLVTLQSVGETGPFNQVSMANWVDWKEKSATLAATALWRIDPVTVGGEEPFRTQGATVHGEFWEVLEARFVAGRPPTRLEAQEDGARVVLRESLWRRLYAGDTSLDDLLLTLDGARYPVAGVVADEHAFPDGAQLWISARYAGGSGGMRNNINHEAIARLRPDVTIEQAASDLSGVARGIRETDPEGIYSYGVGVIPLHERIVGEARRPVTVLMASALLVLLVACANLAGLALARARRRRDDASVRLALGAGRRRLVRQVVAEHALLALLGGAAGLALAGLAAAQLDRFLGATFPRVGGVGLDLPVVRFALLATAASALITGAGPAAAVLRERIAGVHSARGRIRGGRGVPGFSMVAGELALATALLVGGGLLARSFIAAASRELGYDPEDVVTLEVTLTERRYADARASAAYWTGLLERIGEHPGVVAAAAGNWIPTGGSGTSFVELEGGSEADLGAGYRVVTDDYLEAMGIELLRGRTFRATDDHGTERVGLVNRTLAQRYWPGEEPLGKRLKASSMEAYYHGGQAPWITVVGVVADVRHHDFETAPRPELFVLYRQVPDWTRAMTAVVRTDPRALVSPTILRDLVREHDRSLAVDVATLSARVRSLLQGRRLLLGVLWTFAGVALILACLGVYALLSFAAEERSRELAVRAALGADRRGILALMLGDAARVIAAGLAFGWILAFALTALLESLLLDVSPADPLTYGGAALLIAAVGVSAALLPSLRAANADPLAALTP